MTVLNLPGYPNAAEGFPSGQDGVDSYNNAQTITIFPSSFNTFTNTPVNAKDTQPSTWGIQPLTQAQLSSAPVSASSNENNATALVSSNTTGLSQSVECRNGDIRCDGSTKWSICSNGQFIQQDVAPGTLCKMENGVATFGYA